MASDHDTGEVYMDAQWKHQNQIGKGEDNDF